MPLAEHDKYDSSYFNDLNVSIHVPLAEHDVTILRKLSAGSFQFTCPSRSTTAFDRALRQAEEVSIHVPLAEHDLIINARLQLRLQFQFTCPSRSTTRR